jgi:uncharacterized protein YeaO (DUF488 family)
MNDPAILGAAVTRKTAGANIKMKRACDRPAAGDGKRVLIDRLWPRGVTKADAAIDEWMKELAPTTALRKWFGHDPTRWQEFRRRYRKELLQQSEQLDRLRALARQGPVTLSPRRVRFAPDHSRIGAPQQPGEGRVVTA